VALADVPANDGGDATRKVAQKLPPDFRLPNLKPWGLVFQGARFLIIEGRPATQLFYTTDNKALGPLTVVVGTSSRPDVAPTFEHRDDVNLLYWRHHGHAYALVGTADIGYLWNIQNDIAWQLDAI
jgi:anti-sigma factor RsiW